MSSAGALLGTLLLAQGVGGAPPQAPAPFPIGQDTSEGTATVEGVVTRIGTGEPIPLAAVQFVPTPTLNNVNTVGDLDAPDPPPIVRTDAGGRFVIDGLAPGDYRITAFRNGFVRQGFGQNEPGDPGAPVRLQAGRTFEASLQLTPAAVIVGRIVDGFGEPIPNAEVSAMSPPSNPDVQPALQPAASSSTDDRGEYRLFWLEPGEYIVSATASRTDSSSLFAMWTQAARSGGSYRNVEPRTENMAAFYPGVPDRARAAPVRVRAGEERAGVDIRLAVRTTFTISGRVVGPDPLARPTRVSARSSVPGATPLSDSFHSGTVDSRGNFVLADLEPGAYVLQTQAQGIAGRAYTARAPVVVTNRDVENVTLALRPGTDIAVNVFVEEPSAPWASEAVSELDWSRVRVRLRDNDTVGFTVGFTGEPSDARGGFLIENVEPGEYAVTVNVPNGTLYLKRVLVGSEEIAPDAAITVEPGFSERLDVLLSPNGGRIQGAASTTDGEPVANAAIILLPPDTSPTTSASRMAATGSRTLTDGSGNYSLAGIAPGDYLLFAWEATAQVPFLDPEFMRRFAARGERVVIREGDELTVNLEAIPESEIR